MQRSRRLTSIGAAMALALVIAACGNGEEAAPESAEQPTEDADDGDQAPDEDPGEDPADDPDDGDEAGDDVLDDLIAAAEEEGQLTFYSVPDESIARGISEEFMDRYDIQVDFVRLVSADLAQRYSAEAAAGAPAADLILISDSPFLTEAFDEGWLVPIDEAGLPDYSEFPEDFITQGGKSAVVSVNPTVLGYNTDLVDEEPEDWTVLADPAWEGNLAISDPTTSVANLFFWDLLRETYGDDFLRDVAANNPTFTPGAVPSAQAVGAGEVAFGVPAVSAIYDNIAGEGAPVAYASPEVTTGSEIAVGISADGENPNAARLFAHFVITQEGNELLTLPYNTASPYGGNLPDGYQRPNNAALGNEDLIYELLGVS